MLAAMNRRRLFSDGLLGIAVLGGLTTMVLGILLLIAGNTTTSGSSFFLQDLSMLSVSSWIRSSQNLLSLTPSEV
jgi:hypothetical protein